eukprot:SAG31_NODE_2508_length_5589_cov_11.540073_2_plen_97_part_00
MPEAAAAVEMQLSTPPRRPSSWQLTMTEQQLTAVREPPRGGPASCSSPVPPRRTRAGRAAGGGAGRDRPNSDLGRMADAAHTHGATSCESAISYRT